MPNIRDLTGQKFNRFTVLSRAPNNDGGKVVWLCRCECGREVPVTAYHLTRAGTSWRSCGCLRREQLRNNPNLLLGRLARGTYCPHCQCPNCTTARAKPQPSSQSQGAKR